MRRALLSSVLAAVAVAGLWIVHRQLPPPEAIQARLRSASVDTYMQLHPEPIRRRSRISVRVDVPARVARVADDHVAYGELRLLPDGPAFHLSDGGVVEEADAHVCQLHLYLDSNDITTDEMRILLRSDYRFEIVIRVWDQSRVLAESGWLDATSLLQPLASRLR